MTDLEKLRQEMNERFDRIEAVLTKHETKLAVLAAIVSILVNYSSKLF